MADQRNQGVLSKIVEKTQDIYENSDMERFMMILLSSS